MTTEEEQIKAEVKEVIIFIHDHEEMIKKLAKIFRDVEKISEYAKLARFMDLKRM